jgi:hypothetical protein
MQAFTLVSRVVENAFYEQRGSVAAASWLRQFQMMTSESMRRISCASAADCGAGCSKSIWSRCSTGAGRSSGPCIVTITALAPPFLTSWALALFALGIGVFLLVRPSALKGLETAANRWIEPFPSSTKATVPAETGINRLILRAPRFSGLLLLAAGLACLLAFAG